MVWLILALLLIAIFGIGTVLEAALWLLVIVALAAVLAIVGVAKLIA